MIVETPSPKLRQVWNEWLDKYRVLKSSSEIEALAAPFFSSAHINYSMQQRVLLFVGKATDQDYFLPNFENDLLVSNDAAVIGRLEQNRKLVEKDRPSTAFWKLFVELSVAAGNCENLENIVWTNICKIGLRSGPPTDALLQVQKELAIRTLRIEIEEYRPSLVVFVSGKYASEVVISLGKVPEEEWKKSNMPGADSGTWWLRSPTRDSPSFLWTMHPQFKSTLEKQAWVQRALWLMKKK